MKSYLIIILAALLLISPLAMAATDSVEQERQEYIETLTGDPEEQEEAQEVLERGRVILIVAICVVLGLITFAAVRRTRN